MLVIQLTDEQMDELKSAYDGVAQMAKDGKPGMLVAQVYYGHMVVGLLNHERSSALQKALGGESSVGKTTTNASDRYKLKQK